MTAGSNVMSMTSSSQRHGHTMVSCHNVPLVGNSGMEMILTSQRNFTLGRATEVDQGPADSER